MLNTENLPKNKDGKHQDLGGTSRPLHYADLGDVQQGKPLPGKAEFAKFAKFAKFAH